MTTYLLDSMGGDKYKERLGELEEQRAASWTSKPAEGPERVKHPVVHTGQEPSIISRLFFDQSGTRMTKQQNWSTAT